MKAPSRVNGEYDRAPAEKAHLAFLVCSLSCHVLVCGRFDNALTM